MVGNKTMTLVWRSVHVLDGYISATEIHLACVIPEDGT